MTERDPLQPLSPSRREALEEATASYQAAVFEGDEKIVEYLAGRGIDEATALTSRLGVVRDPLPGHERYRGMVSIPYLDRNSSPVAIRFRCIEDHEHQFHGKYNSLPGDPPRMYGITNIFEAVDEIHLTEGEFDSLILRQCGLPAVAVAGAQVFMPHHRAMLAGFSRVFVWGDPDDAGADLVNKVCRQLRQAKGVRLRDGDVTDTYLKGGGAAALLALLPDMKVRGS